MITQEQLDNWQSLCDAATPEPWVVAPHYSLVPPTYHRIMACVGTDVYAKGDCDSTADPVFAAAARTAVPALLDEVKRLRLVLDEWKTDCEIAQEENRNLRNGLGEAKDEIERLRGLVREAFIEGLLKFWMAAGGPVMNCDVEFDASKAVAKLKGGGA